MDNFIKEFILFQYKCLQSDVNFADFDQVCDMFWDSINNAENSQSPFFSNKVKEIISVDISDDIFNNYNNSKWLEHRITQIKKAINSYWDVKIDTPVYIVDNFPGNIALPSWKAMSVDKKQSLVFNIPIGIYYKSNYVVPVLFEILIAHEIMHQVLYKVSKHFRSIKSTAEEEGLCDFFSYLILIENNLVNDEKCLQKFILSNRALCYYTNYIRYTYWLYSYKACIIYSTIGKKAFISDYIIGGKPLDISKIGEYTLKNDTFSLSKLSIVFYDTASKVVISEDEYIVYEAVGKQISRNKLYKIINKSNDEIDIITEKLQNKWIVSYCNNKIINNIRCNEDVFFFF